MKTQVIVSVQTMIDGSQPVRDWCVAVNAFTAADEMHSQKSDLMGLIDGGIETMNSARLKLEDSSSMLNLATGKLAGLEFQFDVVFQSNGILLKNEQSRKMIAKLKETLSSTGEFYDHTRARIHESYRRIGELKLQADKIKFSVPIVTENTASGQLESRNSAIESAQLLVAKCNEFNAIP